MRTCGKAKTMMKDPQPSPSGANLNSRKNTMTAKPSRPGYRKAQKRSFHLTCLNDLGCSKGSIRSSRSICHSLRLAPRRQQPNPKRVILKLSDFLTIGNCFEFRISCFEFGIYRLCAKYSLGLPSCTTLVHLQRRMSLPIGSTISHILNKINSYLLALTLL
jgi:hypothetical protein